MNALDHLKALLNALDHLRALLDAARIPSLNRPWRVEREIDGHISRLEKYIKDGASQHVPKDRQEEAIRRFWISRRLDNLKDARLVCFGVALPMGPQSERVIEDPERFPALLDGADQFLPKPRQYRRCYQGLLSGYFAYDRDHKDTPPAGRTNWETLRTYLGDRAKKTIDDRYNPAWVDSLQQHQTLFSTDPCGRYGPPMLDGDSTEIDVLRSHLNISDKSWFMRRLFLAQINAAIQRIDSEFLTVLERILAMIRDNGIIHDEGLALVLNRHACIPRPPLAIPLRDAAVSRWGNPWLALNSMRWGHVTPAARAMVAEWLKLEFIEAFFTLLAEERSGDSRRLEFWKRYVHAIDSIHFALGTDARTSKRPDFVTLRKKMEKLSIDLDDALRTNNAFIMQMGPVVIVEFGGYSNACYGYDATRPLPFDYGQRVVTRVNAHNSLKHSAHRLKWRHQDGIHGWSKWEQWFEAELTKHFNIRPKTPSSDLQLPQPTRPTMANQSTRTESPPPTQTPLSPVRANTVLRAAMTTTYRRQALSVLAAEFGLRIDDLTADNGNLWVRTDDSNRDINTILLRWGFQYRAGKGWWKGR
ncbi:MAG: hypothetical protein IPH23_10645 [Gammaproteobacteria bacterium]|nr:hypothetical protein [Gammaproteobacteria bacterium]